jgi:hypothetical protein
VVKKRLSKVTKGSAAKCTYILENILMYEEPPVAFIYSSSFFVYLFVALLKKDILTDWEKELAHTVHSLTGHTRISAYM